MGVFRPDEKVSTARKLCHAERGGKFRSLECDLVFRLGHVTSSCVPLLPYLRVNHRNTSRPSFDSSGFAWTVSGWSRLIRRNFSQRAIFFSTSRFCTYFNLPRAFSHLKENKGKIKYRLEIDLINSESTLE